MAGNAVKAASQEAVKSLKSLAGNPVGGLAGAYEGLGDKKALSVGIAFGVISLICFLLGGFFLVRSTFGGGVGDIFDFLGFGGVMKLILFAVMPFVSLAVFSAAIRKISGGAGGGFGGDAFIAGAAILPIAIVILIGGIVGMGSPGAVKFFYVLNVIGSCVAILILFAGLTRISKLSERVGTIAVPIVILLSGWLSYSVFEWMMTPSGSAYSEMGHMPSQRDFERAMEKSQRDFERNFR
jgi:hypothetical protein